MVPFPSPGGLAFAEALPPTPTRCPPIERGNPGEPSPAEWERPAMRP